MSQILLVDESDQPLGYGEKLAVHRRGLLHRAFSVFIFNYRGELLLQKRAIGKYHSNGLWSNTCCGHFSRAELTDQEVSVRLKEEMGLICPSRESFIFTYQARFENGLIENEVDHIFVGRSNERPCLNPQEASAYKYLNRESLKKDLRINPGLYTVWLKIIMDKYG